MVYQFIEESENCLQMIIQVKFLTKYVAIVSENLNLGKNRHFCLKLPPLRFIVSSIQHNHNSSHMLVVNS